MAMEQEIRENAGNEMQDNIENVEGTKKWGNLENNATGSSGTEAEAEADQSEFPRASEEEVFEAAERAKAKFGGTYDGGGGVESEADESIAQGEDSPAEASATTGGGEAPSAQNAEDGGEAPSAQDVEDQAEAGDELTTGQKFAGILASDSNMKWESKIAEKLSGGDDENTSGA